MTLRNSIRLDNDITKTSRAIFSSVFSSSVETKTVTISANELFYGEIDEFARLFSLTYSDLIKQIVFSFVLPTYIMSYWKKDYTEKYLKRKVKMDKNLPSVGVDILSAIYNLNSFESEIGYIKALTDILSSFPKGLAEELKGIENNIDNEKVDESFLVNNLIEEVYSHLNSNTKVLGIKLPKSIVKVIADLAKAENKSISEYVLYMLILFMTPELLKKYSSVWYKDKMPDYSATLYFYSKYLNKINGNYCKAFNSLNEISARVENYKSILAESFGEFGKDLERMILWINKKNILYEYAQKFFY